MNITTLIRRECVSAGRAFETKPEVLAEITRLAKQCPLLDRVDRDRLQAGFEAREVLGSTGFTHGLALPHCRVPGLTEFVLGLLSVPEGVPFNSLDGQKSRLFLFVVAPENAEEGHLRVLAALAKAVSANGALAELSSLREDETLYSAFLRFLRETETPPSDNPARS